MNKALLAWLGWALLLTGCAAGPGISTDVSYCCEATASGVSHVSRGIRGHTRIPETHAKDEAAIVLATKGVEYTEGDAHAVLRMTFVNRTLENATERALDDWERIAPGGGVRFIAEVQLEMTDAVTRERIFSGVLRRVHNVYEGSYMHEAPARTAMRSAFLTLFADYPDAREVGM